MLGATSSYPLLNLFWTMLMIFLFVIWIFILFQVFVDIFRSRDMGGGVKAIWVIFVILLPFLGVLVYLLARGGKMHEHQVAAAKEQEQAMQNYIRQAGGTDTADQLAKLHDLKEKGGLTDAEYEAAKAKLIS